MKADSLDIKFLADGTAEVVLTTSDRSCLTHLSMLASTGKPLNVEVKRWREKRSLTQNSYLWQLCSKIATEIKSTREDVYKQAVRHAGKMTFVAVPDNAVNDFIRLYTAEGLGNYAEATEKAKKPEYTVIAVYHGSSGYDTAEMTRLVDYVVEEAKNLGIETLTPDQLKELRTHA